CVGSQRPSAAQQDVLALDGIDRVFVARGRVAQEDLLRATPQLLRVPEPSAVFEREQDPVRRAGPRDTLEYRALGNVWKHVVGRCDALVAWNVREKTFEIGRACVAPERVGAPTPREGSGARTVLQNERSESDGDPGDHDVAIERARSCGRQPGRTV